MKNSVGELIADYIREQLTVIIFDLDGVITSENRYWDTARLAVFELISNENYLGIENYFEQQDELLPLSPEAKEKVISSEFIYQLKCRAINSNWDLTYYVSYLHLVGILFAASQIHSSSLFDILTKENLVLQQKLSRIKSLLNKPLYSFKDSEPIISRFLQETSRLYGSAIYDFTSAFTKNLLGIYLPAFEPKGELWQLCYQNFQDWYTKKAVFLPYNDTVVDAAKIDLSLKILYNSRKYTLAVATGRPRVEALQPLNSLGFLKYFDKNRVVTYDDVLEAESLLLRSNNIKIKLSKPHPFILYKATYPDKLINTLHLKELFPAGCKHAAYVGDTASDIIAAKNAGCLAFGVLSGFADGKKEDKRNMFVDLGCDLILENILELPGLLGLKVLPSRGS